MIAKEFEAFLLSHLDNFLIPAEELAIFIDTHSPNHAMLLLVNNGYSRVPVITKDKKYVGTISIADIMSYQSDNQLTDWELAQTDIGKWSILNWQQLVTLQVSQMLCTFWLIIHFYQF